MSIGENIKKIRKEKNLTQQALAKKMKISRSYLSDLENNRYNPSSKTVEMFAEKLGVSMLFLTTGKKALADLTDEEKAEAVEDFHESVIKNKKEMQFDFKKEIKEILNSELSFIQTVYLNNLLTYLKISTEDDIGFLAAFISQLNAYKDAGNEEDVTQEELAEFIDEGVKEIKTFLVQRFKYKGEN